MKPLIGALIAATTLATGLAQAQVTAEDAWVRATVPQQKATGAFMKLNGAKDTRLVSVTSPAAPVVEVHEMALQDNVMRMRQVPGVELPAGKTVELRPGGYHIMLMDLPKPLKAGETVPLTLVFEGKDGRRESLDVQAPVRPVNASAAPAGQAQHKH